MNESLQELIVAALGAAGLSSAAISNYQSQIPPLAHDNIEVLSSYWTQFLVSNHTYTYQVADVCLYLRDTNSKMLWMQCFNEHIIPFLINNRILE